MIGLLDWPLRTFALTKNMCSKNTPHWCKGALIRATDGWSWWIDIIDFKQHHIFILLINIDSHVKNGRHPPLKPKFWQKHTSEVWAFRLPQLMENLLHYFTTSLLHYFTTSLLHYFLTSLLSYFLQNFVTDFIYDLMNWILTNFMTDLLDELTWRTYLTSLLNELT